MAYARTQRDHLGQGAHASRGADAARKGTKLSEHQAAEPLTFHVLSGSVTFPAGARVESLGPGDLIVLESAVAHEVEAVEETACLLTLAGAVAHAG